MSAMYARRITFTDNELPYNNTILTSNLVNVISKTERNEKLNKNEYKTISDAKELLSKIIEGSKLVENKAISNMTYSIEEGILNLDFALSTVESLNLSEEEFRETTEFFEKIMDRLEALIQHKCSKQSLTYLKMFFLELSNSFKGEIINKYLKAPVNLKRI